MYSLFLSNVGYGLSLSFPLITPLWSVGTEEQFYLFWPIIINFFKKIIFPILAITFFIILLKVSFHFFLINDSIDSIISVFSFDAMAIGAIGSYLVYTKSH